MLKSLVSSLLLIIAAAFLGACSPVDPKAELMAAHRLLQKKQYGQALPKSVTCLSIDRDNVDAIIINAVCVFSLPAASPEDTSRKNALLNLQRATTILAPERFDAWYTYVWALVQNRDFDSAVNAARFARNLYRSQQTNPPVPKSDACDTHDIRLARENISYANLLCLYADICRYNSLEEGLPFFNAVCSFKAFQSFPGLYLAYAQLLFSTRQTRAALNILKQCCLVFQENVYAAYNYAVVNDYRTRNMELNAQQRNRILLHYKRAYGLAQAAGQQDIAQRAHLRIGQMQR